MIRRRGDIVVSSLRTESCDGGYRASADVDGIPLWFESSDVELAALPEAFGSALLLTSQHYRRRLVIERAVCSRWAGNVSQVIAKWASWWGYTPLEPAAQKRDSGQPPNSPASALCFSGGVDSFYSLHIGPCPDFLVAVHGFDIPLADRVRMAGLERTLSAAADSVGARPIIIRTNLREHPVSGRPKLWERSHGGALAAIGHILGPNVSRLFISSTYSINPNKQWGSSVHTDHLFSSSVLEVVHFGTAPREEKIQAILTHPMVRDHLRVCWENRKPEGNCSRCPKCLLVMLHLAEYGVLEEFAVFEGAEDLSDRLDAVPYLSTHVLVMQRAVERGRLEPRLSEAANRLVERSLRAVAWRQRRARIRDLVDRYV